MSRSGRTRKIRVGLGALAIAAMPFATACSASFGAETQSPYDPAEGVGTDSGDLDLRNVVVVADTDERGTLVGVLINQGDRTDRLTGVQVADGRSAISSTDDGVELPPDTVIALGADSGGVTALPASVEGEQIVEGYTVRLTFDFVRAASVTVDAQVVPREGAYADVPAATPPGPEEPDRSES